MKTLVLNCGSSSIKYKFYDLDSKKMLAKGGIEKIGLPGSFLIITSPAGEKITIEKDIPNHEAGINVVLNTLTDEKYGCISSFKEIDAVGHRVVHGGEKFSTSVLIDDEVIAGVIKCAELAPLHNPANLEGIYAMQKILPGMPQVAVFDTAFHQTMPDYAYIYGLPYELYQKYGIRRYGFHGISHRYVSQRACEILNVPYEKQRIITAHIGNGASITAIKYGKSIDTSMGLTPLEGLLMGTRCGDIDPGILSFIMNKEGMDADDLSNLLNKKSGILGISGVSSDMRELEAAIEQGNPRAILAMQIYSYRIKKYTSAYASIMGGVDILVFTGGVGENQCSMRRVICQDMEFMGIYLDSTKNQGLRGQEMVINAADSKVHVIVVPTDEEYVIALDTQKILCG